MVLVSSSIELLEKVGQHLGHVKWSSLWGLGQNFNPQSHVILCAWNTETHLKRKRFKRDRNDSCLCVRLCIIVAQALCYSMVQWG